LTGIKHISIDGKGGNDILFYQGNTVGANIDGGAGDDVLTVLDTGTGSSTVQGSAGNDSIILLFSPNASLSGGSGNDFIAVNAHATNRNPPYNYASSKTIVTPGSGDDTIVVYAGTTTLDPSSGADTVFNVDGTVVGT